MTTAILEIAAMQIVGALSLAALIEVSTTTEFARFPYTATLFRALRDDRFALVVAIMPTFQSFRINVCKAAVRDRGDR